MTETRADDLVQFLRGEAGDYLRAALHYTSDDYEVLYARDDVDAVYTDGEVSAFVDYYREKRRELAPGRPFDLGNDHCTVSVYDEAILFHFTQGADVGTIVTLAPEAGRDIVQFITACLGQLYHNSPQDIDNVPVWLRE